jgi:hypothetical protein
MKELKPKAKPIEPPVIEPEKVIDEPVIKVIPKTKEAPDYTWVWILIGLLATIALVYFTNVNNPPKDGHPESK